MHGIRSPFSTATIAAVVTIAGCQSIPAPAPTPGLATASPALEAFAATPPHQGATDQAARASDLWRTARCPASASLGPSRVTVVEPGLTYGPYGNPVRGTWTEQMVVSGCSPLLLLNVSWTANEGRVTAEPNAVRADP